MCEGHRSVIDQSVHQKVANLALKRSAEDLLERLQPIAIALDKVRSDGCTIADAVEVWKTLETKLPLKEKTLKKCTARYEQAVTSSQLLANVLHPAYQGKS